MKATKATRTRRHVFLLVVLASVAMLLSVFSVGNGDLVDSQAVKTIPQKASDSRISVGVCVTGQLCRLELQNKFHYFLSHVRHTHDLYLVAALQDDESCGFTNPSHVAGAQFSRFSEVESWLEKNEIRGKAILSNVANPVVNDRYVYSLKKRGKVNETQRAIHHYSQWHNLESCWKEFAEQGTRDVYLKLRDDSIFVSKFRVEDFVTEYVQEKEFHAKKVFVPACLGWGGINDKSAIALSGSAREFFLGPKIMYLQYDKLECSVNRVQCQYLFNTYNPESFLQQALEAQAVEVIRVEPRFYPIVTGTAIHYGRTACFHDEGRQLGAGRVCLPEHLQKKVVFGCMIDPISSTGEFGNAPSTALNRSVTSHLSTVP